MTLPRATPVLVVGLGPAGAATAIRLAKAGIDVTAIDRAEFPRDKVCSEFMSPETVRHLTALGVLATIEPFGVPLAGATVLGPRGARLTGLFAKAGVAPFRSTGLSLPRLLLDNGLVEAARSAGVRIVERARLQNLLYRNGAVAGAVVDVGGVLREVKTQLIVGADGLRSVIARLVGRRRYGKPSRYGFVAHVNEVAGVGSTAQMHVGTNGYVGLNRVGPDLTNVAVVVPARLAAEARGDPEGFWHRTIESFPALQGRVRRDAIARSVIATGPFAAWSSRVAVDGAVLVGDAADFFDPFTGEGICAALIGAELLEPHAAEALGRTGRPVTRRALAAYTSARFRRFAGKWAVERMIGYGMLLPNAFDRAVERLERRGLAHTLIGVTGDFVPARMVLRPAFLASMML